LEVAVRISRLQVNILLFLLAILSLEIPARGSTPGGDAYFGYSRLGSDAFNSGAGGLNGWQLAGYLKVRTVGGFEADLARYGIGASSTTPHSTTFLVGPRVAVRLGLASLFAHALIGGEHSSDAAGYSGGALAWGLGAGADLPLAKVMAWRVAADYLSAPTQSPSGGTHARFTTGVVVRF
jgi:hypothetical protein